MWSLVCWPSLGPQDIEHTHIHTCETHPALSALLSDPTGARQLAPTTAATAAVRRASLGPLPLVGPGEEAELESDVTCICATSYRCALTAAR